MFEFNASSNADRVVAILLAVTVAVTILAVLV